MGQRAKVSLHEKMQTMRKDLFLHATTTTFKEKKRKKHQIESFNSIRFQPCETKGVRKNSNYNLIKSWPN